MAERATEITQVIICYSRGSVLCHAERVMYATDKEALLTLAERVAGLSGQRVLIVYDDVQTTKLLMTAGSLADVLQEADHAAERLMRASRAAS